MVTSILSLLQRRPTQTSTDDRVEKILSIQIDITNACNLSCAHCYHPDHKNNGAVSLSEWKLILVQYQDLLRLLKRSPSIIICGGEPMVSPMLLPLLQWIRFKFGKIPITILTNGTIFNSPIVDELKHHQTLIQISIDGPTAESHNSVRGSRAFERSLANITRYQSAGINVALLGILSLRTSKILDQFFDLARSIDVSHMKFTRFITSGTGQLLNNNGGDRPLESEELKEAYKEIILQSRRTRVATNSNKALFHLLDNRLGEHEQFGFNGIVVDFKGNMKVSSRIPLMLGNLISGKNMSEIFLKHPLMKDLRNPKKHECGGCMHFRRCGGGKNSAWAATGNLFAKDPGCWYSPDNTSSKTERGKVS